MRSVIIFVTIALLFPALVAAQGPTTSCYTQQQFNCFSTYLLPLHILFLVAGVLIYLASRKKFNALPLPRKLAIIGAVLIVYYAGSVLIQRLFLVKLCPLL